VSASERLSRFPDPFEKVVPREVEATHDYYRAKRAENSQWLMETNVPTADVPLLRSIVATWPCLDMETAEPSIFGEPAPQMEGYTLVTFYGRQYDGRLGDLWQEFYRKKAQ